MNKLLKHKWFLLSAIVLVAVVVVLVIVSLTSTEQLEIKQGSSGDAVFIKISDNGISSDSSEVVIRNFHKGARAEMTYRIHNATGQAIMPEIFLVLGANVTDYSKADGAVRAPDYVMDWITLPQLTEIPPGQIKDFLVVIEMPKDAPEPAEKIGFQIGVASKTEGKLQPAVGIWWLVNMR